MGDGGVDHARVEHARQMNIGGVFARAVAFAGPS